MSRLRFFSLLCKRHTRVLAHPCLSTCAGGSLVFLSPVRCQHEQADPRQAASVLGWQQGLPTEDDDLGLPDPEEAPAAVVIRNVLTDIEIDRLLAAFECSRSSFGSVCRDAAGVHQLRGSWETVYLHTEGWFQNTFQEIQDKLCKVIEDTDRQYWGLLAHAPCAALLGPPVVRNVELHTMKVGAGLTDPKHIDRGTLWTLDVMLSKPNEDFIGGILQTTFGLQQQPHELRRGDALAFAGHCRHCVTPVRKGTRQVLVIEFWHGEQRTCAHRCLQRWGECQYSTTLSRVERIIRASSFSSDDPVPLFG